MTHRSALAALTLLLAPCLLLADCTPRAERAAEQLPRETGPIGPIVDDRVLYSGKLTPSDSRTVNLIVRQIAVSNASGLKLKGFDRPGSALLQGKAGRIELTVDAKPVMIDDGRTAAISTPATVAVSSGNDTVLFEATQIVE